MSTEPSVLNLVLGASLPVQIVLVILLVASVASWALIFHKSALLRAARARATRFEESFWSGGSLSDFYDRLSRDARPREGQEAIFEAGFREFKRLRQTEGRSTEELLEGVARAMRVTLNRQIERFDEGLSLLATIGSVSPYVGLFGTVWGIMSAFMNLGNMQNATLATVAPPIAEALIATAMGLFAAIPAVVAYNRYSGQVDELYGRYDHFTDEFLGLLQRQIGGQ